MGFRDRESEWPGILREPWLAIPKHTVRVARVTMAAVVTLRHIINPGTLGASGSVGVPLLLSESFQQSGGTKQ